jgi:predicted flap endonuclease-1-like 5' DNA nuclease
MTRVSPAVQRLVAALLAASLLAVLAARPAWAQEADESILRVGEDVRVESGEVIDGDVTVLFADLEVEEGGEIGGHAVVVLGDMSVDGTVGGDVTTSGDLTVGDQAHIGGNATVLGELVGDEDAIEGRLVVPDSGYNLRPLPGQLSARRAEVTTQERVAYGITSVAVATLVAMLLVALTRLIAPTATARVSRGVSKAPAQSFALGCAAWLILPIVLAAVAITIIGIPIVLIAWGVLLLLGWTALSAMLGGRLLGGSRSLAAAVLGALVLSLVVSIVSALGWSGLCAGSMLGFVLTAAPLGAALRTGFGTRWWPSPPDEGEAPAPPPQAGEEPPPGAMPPAQGEGSSSAPDPGSAPPAQLVDSPPGDATGAGPQAAATAAVAAAAVAHSASDDQEAPPAAAEPGAGAAPASAAAVGAPSGELTQVPGITPVYALLLRQAGITDLASLAAAAPANVVEVASPPGVTPIEASTAERWIETAGLLMRG